MSIKEKNGIKEVALSDTVLPQKENIPENSEHLTEEKLTLQNISKAKKAMSPVSDSIEAEFHNKQIEAEILTLKEQLQANEQYLLNLTNAINTTNASVELNMDGNILNANKNFLKIMGYTAKDLLGKHHSILVDTSYSKSNAYQFFWNSLKKGIYQRDEFILTAKNGKLIWFLGSYNPIFDAQGKPYKILKIATDITLTKTQFLQLAVQADEKEKRSSELIIANKELAFQNKEKENRAAELIIANKELKFQNDQKEKRAEELIIANKELAIQSREKEKRAAELIIANKKLASEKILKEKRKVQKLKRAAELIVKNRELAYQEKRSSELTLANDELKKAQEELGSFSYSVSHDLRAPIRAINGYTQILIEDHADSIDDDGKKIIQAIINNSNKMGILIDDLLAFSKLGRKEVSSTNINMTSLVNGVINDITFEKGENTPIFEIEELAHSYGDPSLIKQVWINLISNAIKYSKYKPEIKIKITSTSQEDKIIYSLKDWGAGFDMTYYDKLFGVFQRLHSQEEFTGTGIGLAIVQKIVSRHSGTVWAESKLDEGATFYFSLPNIKH
ncbi:PAS domain S-box protein [Flavobacterium sp. ANB]|uniref:PAS domain-containing sensor histidine kinase n=1 Tax=unclassified Flavobacterium TaxID=196869 RepID=UPI0012B83BA1|nr:MULTISPECIES: ATP-binding protein [unclassified Flavobacterium]MBF4518781.1 PAS domain S-box protein [Flavobacterium sp. ANB]MTD71506.1 PAS domain S-box protein [Flavobacterium sp. LC2016-13]